MNKTSQLEAILDVVDALIVVLDRQGHIVRFNPACEKATGFSFEEVENKPLWDILILPEEREGVKGVFDQLNADMFPNQYENYWLTKEGGRMLIAWSNTALLDDQGNVESIVGTGLDITKRRQAEAERERLSAERRQALQDQKQLYEIIESSPVVVFRWRAAEGWPVEFVSDNVRQFGYTPEDFYSGRVPYASIVHPDDLERVGAEVTQYSQEPDQTHFSQEYRILSASGEVRWTDDRTWIRRDTEGNITHYQGTILDITERKKADAEHERLSVMLKNEQQMLQTVLENMPVGVFVAEAPTGKPLLANERAKALLGKGIDPEASKDELAEIYAAYLYGTDELYPTERMPLVRGMSGEVSMVDDMEIRHPDGRHILIQVFGAPIRDASGEVTSSIAMFQDITEYKKAEKERERLQQEVIEAQERALKELSTPIIPVMDTPQGSVIVMPLVGSIDSMRARDVTRALLAGISQYRAKIVILDITGVPIVDSGVANHLNKTIQAARLKGARTIITGISDAVAEAIVDLGIDWSKVQTLRDLQTGLVMALNSLGFKVSRQVDK